MMEEVSLRRTTDTVVQVAPPSLDDDAPPPYSPRRGALVRDAALYVLFTVGLVNLMLWNAACALWVYVTDDDGVAAPLPMGRTDFDRHPDMAARVAARLLVNAFHWTYQAGLLLGAMQFVHKRQWWRRRDVYRSFGTHLLVCTLGTTLLNEAVWVVAHLDLYAHNLVPLALTCAYGLRRHYMPWVWRRWRRRRRAVAAAFDA